MSTENSEKSLATISRNENGVDIVDDLELVELRGGQSPLDLDLGGINCPSNYYGNCVPGCACPSAPSTPSSQEGN